MEPYSRIKRVTFNLNTSEDIARNSVHKATTRDIFKGGIPDSEGVYSLALGTTSKSHRCTTCLNDKDSCFGHFGNYTLNYPVFHPLAHSNNSAILRALRVFCFKCGEPVYKYEEETTYTDLIARIKSEPVECERCGAEHPHVTKNTQKENSLFLQKYANENAARTIYPHEIEQIFARIPYDTIETLQMGAHPSAYLVREIPIPPVNIRPEIVLASGGKSNTNSITSLIRFIMEINQESIPKNVPETGREKFERSWNQLNRYVEGLITSTATASRDNRINRNNTSYKSYADTLVHKEGIIRQHMQSKRIFMIGRSTIKCDATLPANVILIPKLFAETIQFIEYVQPWNRAKLNTYVNNTISGTYPAAKTIVKASTGARYAIDKVKSQVLLEDGDLIERDMIDGDIVYFNRQPSMEPSSLTACEVRISQNETAYAIAMNVIACDFYNADFDKSLSKIGGLKRLCPLVAMQLCNHY